MKKALSIILCLAMLMSTVPVSVFAAPTAVTVGDSAIGSESAELSNESFTVTYDKATGATVNDMPENETASGVHAVTSVTPKRRGYTFEGWTLTPGSNDVVKTVNVKKDVTLYAKWGKGGYTVNFANEGHVMDANGAITLADGNKISVGTHAKDIAYDAASGAYSMKINGNDFMFFLNAKSDTAINIDSVKKVIFGIKTPATGSFSHIMYYATKDASGNWIAKNNGDGTEYASSNYIPHTAMPLSGEASEIQELVVDTSVKPDKWKGYLHHLRLDIENSSSFIGQNIEFYYVKLVGNNSVEYIDFNMPAPEASDVAYDANKLSNVSETFDVANVSWAGPELIDGKYFADESVYSATVELKAKEGYVLSDAPAMVTVNGSEATVSNVDGKTFVTYTFPATEKLADIELYVSTKDEAAPEITESLGKLQLVADVYSEEDVSGEVYWSIDDSQKRYASVDKNGVVTANTDCEALVVTATSKYNPAVKATITIKITGQIPESNIYFHKGTGEEVTNMPEATLGKDEFVLPTDVIPVRDGYAFKGWSKELGGEVIKVDDVHEDTTYYAVWGYSKGEEFDGTSDIFTSKSSASTYYEDGSLVVIPNNAIKNEGFMFQAGNGIFGARNRILTDDIEYIEIKTTLAPDETELCVYVQSGTKSGGSLTAWNESANKRFYSNKNEISNKPDQEIFKYVEKEGDWYIYKLPTSILNNWTNYLNQIRFNFIQREVDNSGYVWKDYPAGAQIKFDYIRFVGKDIPALDITGVSVPTVKGEASKEVVAVQDKAFKVTNVTWEPALLGGIFFGSNTEYTVSIEISVPDGNGYNSISNPPARVSVNGIELDVVENYKRKNAKGGTISYTFPATEDVGDLSLVTVTLHEGNDGGVVTETRQIFSGDDFDLNKFIPENAPTGYRWYGWSTEENGEPITEPVNLSEDADYYALYELISGFDFSVESHKSDKNVKAENGTLKYDGAWAVVDPDTKNSKAALVLDNLSISSTNYDFVEIIYDGSLEDANNENKFSEKFTPVLKVAGTNGKEIEAALVKSELVVASKRVAYKYTYDLTVNGKTDSIAKLILAPYEGDPAWAVTSVKLIENVAIEEPVVISNIRLPEAWDNPDTSAVVSDKYEFVSIDWSPKNFNDNGTFLAETEYTATVVVKPQAGYKITQRTAYYEEELLSGRGVVTLNSNGTLSVKKKFPATPELMEFTLTVADAVIDEAYGSVALTPVFKAKETGEEVPEQTVTWSITSNGPEGKSATIDENGVVSAHYDGDVVVVATSNYNPDVSASATVRIKNQIPFYTVTFDPNTASDVTNMPDEVHVKYEYNLPQTAPVRPGFSFAGWVTSPSSTTPVSNVYVTEDVTYYALWLRGAGYDFNVVEEAKLKISNANAVSSEGYDYNSGTYSFTTAGTDPQIYIEPKSGEKYILCGNDYRTLEVRVKTSVAAGFNWGMYFESIDADGNVLGPSYAADSKRYVANNLRSAFSTSPDKYTTFSFDLSTKSDWVDGYITKIRLDLPDDGTEKSVGVTYTFDYIRFVNYETNEVEISGVAVPEAAGEVNMNAVGGDESRYYVTDVSWTSMGWIPELDADGNVVLDNNGEPKLVYGEKELLYGHYYDGLTDYTVNVKVKGVPGYFMSDAPSIATINGYDVTATEYDAATGELTLKYTFPTTGEIKDYTNHEITLVTVDNSGELSEETITFLKGDVFEIGSYLAANIPAGKRWVGWSEDEEAVVNGVNDSLVINGDATYYAVYEDIVDIDFSNYHDTIGFVSKNDAATLSFKNDMAVMSVTSESADCSLVSPFLGVNGKEYPLVEVYFDKSLSSSYDKVEYSNRFAAILSPELKFSTTDYPNSFSYSGTIINSETVTIDGRLYQKYVYDMSDVSAWFGRIGKLQIDPYNGYPDWAVRLIKFISSTEVDEAAEINVAAPKTWEVGAMRAADVSINDNLEVTSIDWTPKNFNADGSFKPETVYSAKITYKAKPGYEIVNTDAVINGKDSTATYNGNGTYSATIIFDETESLKNTKVVISGANEINRPGRYLDLKAETVALDGSKIPVKGVTWSIANQDEEIADDLAVISQNGRVYPGNPSGKEVKIANGTVVVTATSIYDPTVSATHVVEISNQYDLPMVIFDKNTQADVEGIPTPVFVYGEFVPEGCILKRDGFFFTGWSTDEDALEPDETFNIKEDTILYATWAAGYEWSFDNDATSLKANGRTVSYNNGIATFGPASDSSSQVLAIANGLSTTLGLETAKHQTLEVRLSLAVNAIIKFYLQAASADGKVTTVWSEDARTGSMTPSQLKANASGEFQVVSFDLSKHKTWNNLPYVHQVRLDLPEAAPKYTNQVDYVRLLNAERKVKFDANGGYIPFLDDEVISYKQTSTKGIIQLPENPTREGYMFLGWGKDPEIKLNENTGNFTKLYNGSFPLADNVTLYAIWAVADETETVAVDETKSLEINMGDMTVGNEGVAVVEINNFKPTASGNLVIEFVTEDGVKKSVVLNEAKFNGDGVYVKDLESEGFVGNVTDVKVIVPEGESADGKSEGSASVYFCPNEIGGRIQSTNQKNDRPNLKPQASSIVISELTKKQAADEVYPQLAGGTVGETPAKTTKTPADKKVKVPARPADEVAPTTQSTTTSGTPAAANSKFPATKKYDGRFTDVTTANWFYKDVEQSYALGLMNGKSDTTFVPDGTVTIAEAITIAARMNAIYNKADIPAATEGQKWYQPYVDYATKKAIVTATQFSDYNALATREQVALLFVKALPASWYEQKNLFRTIPDVPASSSSFAAIQRLYDAGVVTGVDAAYNFKPADNIKRSEISAIINRVAIKESRIRVITEDEKNNKDKKFNAEELASVVTPGNCVDKEWVINGDGYPTATPAKPDPVVSGLHDLMGGTLNADEYKTIKVVLTSSKASSMVGQQAQLFFSVDGTLSEANSLRTKITQNSDGTLLAQFDGKSNAAWKGNMTVVRFDPWNNETDFSLISVTFAP